MDEMLMSYLISDFMVTSIGDLLKNTIAKWDPVSITRLTLLCVMPAQGRDVSDISRAKFL